MILDDGGDATLLAILGARAEKDPSLIAKPTNEEEQALYAAIKKRIDDEAGLVREGAREHQGRDRRDDDRRAPPLPDGEGRPAALPRHQRERLGHQVEVRQPLRLPRVARRRHQARDRRDDRRQDRGRRRLRRRRQGLRAVAAGPGRERVGHRDRSDLRAAGGDGRLPRRHHGRRRATRATSSSPRPATCA